MFDVEFLFILFFELGDRSLMQALVYDAKVTEFFVKNYTTPLNDHSRLVDDSLNSSHFQL